MDDQDDATGSKSPTTRPSSRAKSPNNIVDRYDVIHAADAGAASLDYLKADLNIDQQSRAVTTASEAHSPTSNQDTGLVSNVSLSKNEKSQPVDEQIPRTRSGAVRKIPSVLKITTKKRTRATAPASKTHEQEIVIDTQPTWKQPTFLAPTRPQAVNIESNISAQLSNMRIQHSTENGGSHPQQAMAPNSSFVPAASSSAIFDTQQKSSSTLPAFHTTVPTSNYLNAQTGVIHSLNSSASAAQNRTVGNPNYQFIGSAANFSLAQNPYAGTYSTVAAPVQSTYGQTSQTAAVPTAFPYNVPHESILSSFPQQQPSASFPRFSLNNSGSAPPLFNNQRTILQNSGVDCSLSSTHVAARHAISKDLPIFTGQPEEWPIFITNYVQSTERCGFTDQENLIRLQKCLKGAALEAVRGKLMMPATIPFAIETLRMLYGRPEIIHQTLQRKLKQEKPVRKDNLETLINFALSVQNYRATMQAMGLADYLNDPMLLNDLLDKLPSDLKLDWGRYCIKFTRVDIVLFDTWLFNLATCAAQVTSYAATTTIRANEEAKGNRKQFKERIFVHDVVLSNKNNSAAANECPKCSQQHRLTECSEFTSLKTDDRWRFVREKKLCIRCFKKHFLRRCNSKKQCGVDGCKMPHNLLLHDKRDYSHLNNESGNSTTKNQAIVPRQIDDSQPVLFHAKEKKKTLFRYIPVTLFGNNRSLNAFALIDEGAACTLIEDEVASALGLEGPSEELCLQWTGDITQKEDNSKIVTLQIASRTNSESKYCLRNVRTVSTLNLPVQTLEKSEIDSCFEFKDVPILPYTAAKARILIGLDNANICVPLQVKENGVDGLIASKCRLGWSIYGRQCGTSSERLRLMHLCPCNTTDHMDNMLRDYFSLEAIGVKKPTDYIRSKDDERSLTIMEKTTKHLEQESAWETGLLWKYDIINLPDSLPMAHRRLQCLESKMTRNPELKTFLNNTIKNYEEKGYIRKLRKDEISSGGKSWYIPIFTVTNKSKRKSRIVWDAAATVNGVSLNSVLLKGPDLLKSLFGILVRFRERPVALSSDIREMFHQVRVASSDQVAQKFLWRYGDLSKPIDTYVMTVMTFGASCSPSLANYIKNKNAENFRKKHPEAVEAIIENTFVDDWLHSCDSEEEIIKIAKLVRTIHQTGGFEMHHWRSNSNRVLTALEGQPKQEGKCIQDLGSQYEKVLGMWWEPTSDTFTFVNNFSAEVFDESINPTKRKILRVVMSIFDPLGLLGFYVIYAKILLQEIWRTGVTWDEPVNDDEKRKWWLWVKLLPEISQIRIPRCYELASINSNIQMHVFVDASINAYAALVYIRMEYGGAVKCSLVASKTRVAPLKPVSIPKLELLAAVLGLRLTNLVMNELSVRPARRTFWTDSKNVLCWIRSDARKYQQFVALRIGEILEGSHVREWRWVPSDDNVADDGTKWVGRPQFTLHSRWFTGPSFLGNDESDWPPMDFDNREDGESEFVCHTKQTETNVSALAAIAPDPTRFSKWEKYCKAQGLVLKFLNRVCKIPFCTEHTKALLKINDIEGVENVIFRKCQEEVYSSEIKSLRCEQIVHRKSDIYKSSPYLDENGVLREKGRIDAIEGVAISLKRPIIMPRKHPVTYLLAEFYHRKYHHHHSEIVVNEMRQRFRINGLRSLVQDIQKRCQICKNRFSKPRCPQMGDLPSERLAVFTRPFHFTGVDYFGPMDVVVGRRREKRWGVLFTCMTVRAVHIEIAPSLSTDSFLLAFKQFISRRGVPQRILSDNATNFRGASRVLSSEIEKINSSDLQCKYPAVEWKFIPPASPHMGGCWERMIKSVKSVLMDILPGSGLREEVLRAALADVENIINSRPLTYVPLQTSDSEALTPNHFLVGSSSGMRERVVSENSGLALNKNFRIASAVADQFWKRWLREYLPGLTRRAKWHTKVADPIATGDVVIVVDENMKRNTWQKGIVVDVHRSRDDQIRSAVVKTKSGFLTRPVVKLAKLDVNK